ncbi:hypothetical protein NJL88_29385 [Streptomyces sp. DK15]|uniref:hypothetical protein n=1 Tax=Streptomyces sp. DK15 TaxID=2957499 RepID=UPI0029BF5AF2|nr:hypothetical protein [Streptomyces sp. DK15]MDX2394101.1 hypothetical protein [Streptomyces sp. DK15]
MGDHAHALGEGDVAGSGLQHRELDGVLRVLVLGADRRPEVVDAVDAGDQAAQVLLG